MFDELNKTYGAMNVKPSSNVSTFEGIASLAASVLVGAASSVSFITLAYAFIQFTTAQGDPKGVEKAQHAALYSAVATLVAVLAYAIRNVVFKAI